ncbi:MAG: FecR domain-containing protein [Candidatus Riflebacteria bacterium]|nr:FecR domain-containing protein [Candidatus Riflebacteria bacterium]
MTCDRLSRWIQDDEALQAAMPADLAVHLEQCEGCRQVWAARQRWHEGFLSLEPAPDIRERIEAGCLARLARSSQPSPAVTSGQPLPAPVARDAPPAGRGTDVSRRPPGRQEGLADRVSVGTGPTWLPALLAAFSGQRLAVAGGMAVVLILLLAWSGRSTPDLQPPVPPGSPQAVLPGAGRSAAAPVADVPAPTLTGEGTTPAAPATLVPGTAFAVADGGRGLLSYPDGSEVRLLPGTRGTIGAGGLTLARGDTRFSMRKQGRQFVIETPTVMLGIRGTDFRVHLREGEAKVVLTEGALRVDAVASGVAGVDLRAGQIVIATRQGLAVRPVETGDLDPRLAAAPPAPARPTTGGDPGPVDAGPVVGPDPAEPEPVGPPDPAVTPAASPGGPDPAPPGGKDQDGNLDDLLRVE